MRRNDTVDGVTRLSDDELVDLAVSDDAPAVAELYRRYVRFARTLVQLSDRGSVDPAAVLAESFRRAFAASRSAGPHRVEFRGVLSAAVMAVNSAGVPETRPAVGHRPVQQDRLRWVLTQMPVQERRVLWHDQVEGDRAAESVRGVAAEQLRRTYLGECLEERSLRGERLDRSARFLVGHVCGTLSDGTARRLASHLVGCVTCSRLLADLRVDDAEFQALDLGRALLDLAPFVLAGTQ